MSDGDEVDISILLFYDPKNPLKNNETDCHALLRFHNLVTLKKFNQKYSHQLFQELQEEVAKRSEHKGFIVTGKSGSNGKPEPTSELFQFLHIESSWPRKAGAVKLLIWGDQWEGYYNQCDNEVRNVVKHAYSQPKKGGKIKMPAKLIDKYKGVFLRKRCPIVLASYVC